MPDFEITSTIAAWLALLALLLSIQVSARRAIIGVKAGVIHKAVFGDADDPGLRNAVRAFGNFVEYAPLVLIMLFLAELSGAPGSLIWWLGGAFIAGRVTHAIAMTFFPLIPAPRGISMLTTYAALGVPAVWLLYST